MFHSLSISVLVNSVCEESLLYNDSSAGLQPQSKKVRNPVMRLYSLSDQYPWERQEPSYIPNSGLNSITVVLQGWLWH